MRGARGGAPLTKVWLHLRTTQASRRYQGAETKLWAMRGRHRLLLLQNSGGPPYVAKQPLGPFQLSQSCSVSSSGGGSRRSHAWMSSSCVDLTLDLRPDGAVVVVVEAVLQEGCAADEGLVLEAAAVNSSKLAAPLVPYCPRRATAVPMSAKMRCRGEAPIFGRLPSTSILSGTCGTLRTCLWRCRSGRCRCGRSGPGWSRRPGPTEEELR